MGRTQRTSLAPEEANTRETQENIERHGQSRLLGTRDQPAAVEQQPQPALASSLDLASFQKLGGTPHLDSEGWLGLTHDTIAAISAFPLDAKIGTETEAIECSYKTASGELILDHGVLCV